MSERNIRQYCVPTNLKRIVLERDDYTCQMCGQMASDIDPYDGNPVRIDVELFIPLSQGGAIRQENLRTICSTCSNGLKEIPHVERPSAQDIIKLLELLPESDLKTLFSRLSAHAGSRPRGQAKGSAKGSVL